MQTASAESRVFPATAGYAVSPLFTVQVDGQPSPVYPARIGPQDMQRRWQAMDDKARTDEIYDLAAFTTFDIGPSAIVIIESPDVVQAVKVLPTSAGVKAEFSGHTITLRLSRPANLTVEVNGDDCHSLNLFANPAETDIPSRGDPNVIYYEPGVHDITDKGIVTRSGQTVYLAGGAVLRAVGKGPVVVHLAGDHVTLRGRGIIDGSLAPFTSRSLLEVTGTNVRVEGIVLHDPPGWTMPLRGANNVTLENLKLYSHRKWGDGIDICNSQDVVVDGCYVRTLDDCIVIKTNAKNGLPGRNILVKRCVIYNEVAHALSIGAEIREPIDNIVFTDCDVIHDVGREWALRVYHCDSAPVTNVRFDHIRIEQSKQLISLWIGDAEWTKDEDRGHISDVVFSDITAHGDPLSIDLHGYDARHVIDKVRFENMVLNGQPMTRSDLKTNPFVQDVSIQP